MNKRKLFTIILMVILVPTLIFSYLNLSLLFKMPFENQKTFNTPYRVDPLGDGFYVIDKSKTEVSIINSNYEVEFEIEGGKKDNTAFFYAECATRDDDKNIYVSDVLYSDIGTQVTSERIFKYSPSGKFEEIFFQYDYDEDNMPLQYANISSVKWVDGSLRFVIKDGSGYEVCKVNNGEKETLKHINFEDDKLYLNNITYNWETDTACFTDKLGDIYIEKDSNIEKVYESEKDSETDLENPWYALIDDDNNVFYADVYNNCICKVEEGVSEKIDGTDEDRAAPQSILSYESEKGILGTTDKVNIILTDVEGNTFLNSDTLSYSGNYMTFKLIVWGCATLAILSILILSFISLSNYFKNNKFKWSTSFTLVIAIVISGAVVAANALTSQTERVNEKIIFDLTKTCASISEISREGIGDKFETFKSLDTYRNEDYCQVKRFMDSFSSAAYQNGNNLYYLLFDVIDGAVVAKMDTEDYVNILCAYTCYEGSGYEDAYEGGEIVKVSCTKLDTGWYSYAFGPIYNSKNEIVGVVEIGTDLYHETLANEAALQSAVISILVVMSLMLLILTELTFFSKFLDKFKNNARSSGKYVLDYIRPLTFLIFLLSGFDNAFIPQLSESLLKKSSFNILPSIGNALPISAQFLFVALLSYIGGTFIKKYGIKKILYLSLILYSVGWVLMGIAVKYESYVILLIAEIIVGSGMGGSTVSMNSIATTGKDENERNDLFAGLNMGIISGVLVGCSLGGIITHLLGYFLGYIIVSIVGIACIWFTVKFVSFDESSTYIESKKKNNIFKFFLNPRIFSYLLFLLVPFLLMLYFKDYLFPLYADSEGLAEVDIGNILLLCGMLSIYIGPWATRKIISWLGAKKSIILASSLYILGLLFFAITPSLIKAIICLIVFSVAYSFGITSQPIYYTSLAVCKDFGESQAVGVSGFFDNFGQTLGPIVFSFAILTKGFGAGCLYIGLVALVLLALFIVINLRKEKQG